MIRPVIGQPTVSRVRSVGPTAPARHPTCNRCPRFRTRRSFRPAPRRGALRLPEALAQRAIRLPVAIGPARWHPAPCRLRRNRPVGARNSRSGRRRRWRRLVNWSGRSAKRSPPRSRRSTGTNGRANRRGAKAPKSIEILPARSRAPSARSERQRSIARPRTRAALRPVARKILAASASCASHDEFVLSRAGRCDGHGDARDPAGQSALSRKLLYERSLDRYACGQRKPQQAISGSRRVLAGGRRTTRVRRADLAKRDRIRPAVCQPASKGGPTFGRGWRHAAVAPAKLEGL